ncbi:unnamed protein product, partial [Meganyctiphanes norvegica]
AAVKSKSRNKPQIQECCKVIETATGLEKKDIRKLADVVFTEDYDVFTRRRILYSLIPKKNEFPYDIIPFAVSSSKGEKTKTAWTQGILQWLGGMLEHRIIDCHHRLMHICYSSIFTMLQQITTCAYAVKVLYFITQVDDITIGRVHHLVQLSKKLVIKDYVAHLQGLYRIYRPDLIASEVRSRRNLLKGSTRLLQQVLAARARLDEHDEEEDYRERAWPEMDLAAKLNPLQRPTAVPHPGIDIYAERLEDRKKEEIFTTHYKTIQDYKDNINCWDKWRWPNNSASHLSYPAIIPLFRPHHMHIMVEIINWLQYALKY